VDDSEKSLEVGGAALRQAQALRLEAKRQRSEVRDQMSEGRGQQAVMKTRD
jgi:hypothetical protein